jgi:hypothetical protein
MEFSLRFGLKTTPEGQKLSPPMGLEIVSRNRVGTVYGKESPVAHQMSILKGGIDLLFIDYMRQSFPTGAL